MNGLHAALLGLVEGITEYLPVSSTGHLILVTALLGLDTTPDGKRAMDAFNVVVQGGAILAVLTLYWPSARAMLAGLLGRDAGGLKLLLNVVVAFLPAAVLGVLLDDWIEARLFHPGPVLSALFVGGLALLAAGRWQLRLRQAAEESDPARRAAAPGAATGAATGAAPGAATGADAPRAGGFVALEQLGWRAALVVGLLQCVAMWPGTSRSMMTILGGLFVGLRPRQAAEFSFLLGLPTLGGACLLKLAKNLLGDGPNLFETLGTQPVLVGLVTATVSAVIAIRWLVGWLDRHGLTLFGWYRIGLSIVLLLAMLAGTVQIAP